jgi:hypothetical protein
MVENPRNSIMKILLMNYDDRVPFLPQFHRPLHLTRFDNENHGSNAYRTLSFRDLDSSVTGTPIPTSCCMMVRMTASPLMTPANPSHLERLNVVA